MGALIRSLDWSATAVGPVTHWPQSLRTAVSILLNSKFPMLVLWGREYVQFYNDAFRPVLGASKHPKAIGQRALECWPEIWHLIGPMFHQVMAGGDAIWSEDLLFLLHRNGYLEETYFTFSYSGIRDESGGMGGVLVTCVETTARVLGERRLRALRELGGQSAMAQDAEHACQLVAQTLRAHTSDLPIALFYLADEQNGARFVGGHGFELDAVPSSDIWQIEQVIQSGELLEIHNVQSRLKDARDGNGDTIELAVVCPIPGSVQGTIAGAWVAGISPRRAFDEEYRGYVQLVTGHIATAIANARAYAQERKRAEALAELDRAKTIFFSNVSHEFRTPLTLMVNPLEDILAQGNGGLPKETRDRVEMAHRNSLRLLKLVNTLLDFSRIEAGRAQAVYEPTDLGTFTAELASVFRSTIEKAGLQLRVECAPLAEPVYVDRELWEKIVFNLLSNAFKFTFEGEIAVTLQPVGECVELSVRDTGIGIAAHEMPNLFQRFHRLKNERARTFEGTGIGLALVQELVKLHGGTIHVVSDKDQGSTFTVSIPFGCAHLPAERIGAARTLSSTALGAAPFVQEAMQWLDAQSESPSTAPLADWSNVQPILGRREDTPTRWHNEPRARILLADDNADMREYLRRLLAPQHDVVAVGDGLSAQQAALQDPPDLILTDVMMPGLDGFELLRRLRADERTQAIPLILLSARAGEESRVEGLEAGADDYLIKPFSAREMVARVRAHLDVARVRREATQRDLAAKQQIANILDRITDAFVAVDREWRCTYLNPPAEGIFARLKKDVLGKNIWQEFPDLVGSPVYDAYHRALREQKAETIEIFYPPLNGWFELHAYPSPDGLSIYFQEVTQRKRAAEGMRLLAEAGHVLAGSLELETLLANVAQLIVQSFADWCVIDLLDQDGTYHQAALAHQDPQKVEWARELLQRYPPKLEASSGAQHVMRTGEPELVTNVPDELLVAHAHDEEHLRLLRDVGLKSYICVPLIAHRHVIGAISVIATTEERCYTPQDLTLAEALAARVALAIENAQLYGAAQQANVALEQRVHERTRALFESHQQLRELAAHVQQAREHERTHLARELHDQLGQDLTALKLDLRFLTRSLTEQNGGQAIDPDIFAEIESLRSQVDRTIQSMRNIVRELRPEGIEELGLLAALEWQAEEFQNRTGIACKFHSPLDSIPLSSDHAMAVYRIVQESLTNVLRHANATSVEIQVQCDEHVWLITVQDNGKGFNRQAGSSGKSFGILGMRERAIMFGGAFEIHSQPGRGTTVCVRIPCDSGQAGSA